MKFENKTALITGGSSGIGLETARLLSRQGAHVWLAARRPEPLEAALDIVQREKRHDRQCCGSLQVDITQPEQVSKAVEEMTRQVGTPDLRFNTAGAAHPGVFEELDLDIFYWMMNVNYYGSLYMTRAVLPGMVKRGSGHIVMFSSLVSMISIYGYTAYAASKFALRGFTDALRMELKPQGIDVSIVFPPDTDTPQLAYENRYKPALTKEIAGMGGSMKADEVAKEVLNGVARNRYLILPGREAKFWYWISNLAGPLQYPILDFIMARAMKRIAQRKPKQ